MSDFFGVVGNLSVELDYDTLLRAANLSALRFDHGVGALCPFEFADVEKAWGERLEVESFAAFRARLQGRNKKFFKGVLYRERRIVEDVGPLEFHWQAPSAAEALDRLVQAKRDQYSRTAVQDSLGVRWHRDLLRQLLLSPPASRCQPVLSTLSAGGCWIASKLSLISGRTFHSWFSVYNPNFRRYGPGHLLWFRTIEKACELGVHKFDFGEGEGGYKAEYCGEPYELLKGVLRRGTLRGRSEKLFRSLQWQLAMFANRRKRQQPDSVSPDKSTQDQIRTAAGEYGNL